MTATPFKQNTLSGFWVRAKAYTIYLRYCAQGKADGTTFVWNVVTSKLHSVLEGPLEKVVDITWPPHFNVLACVAAGKVNPRIICS